MIRDLDAYRRLRETEHWNTLARQSAEESIAAGEALLTSEIMDDAVFPDCGRPKNIAHALGVKPQIGKP